MVLPFVTKYALGLRHRLFAYNKKSIAMRIAMDQNLTEKAKKSSDLRTDHKLISAMIPLRIIITDIAANRSDIILERALAPDFPKTLVT